ADPRPARGDADERLTLPRPRPGNPYRGHLVREPGFTASVSDALPDHAGLRRCGAAIFRTHALGTLRPAVSTGPADRSRDGGGGGGKRLATPAPGPFECRPRGHLVSGPHSHRDERRGQ